MRREIKEIRKIGDNIRKMYSILDLRLNLTNNRLQKINQRLLIIRKQVNEQILNKLEPIYEIPIEYLDD
ncbi:MAG: hypothetical protein EAX96_06820 [Candidatus Lokiarchaeota archaeon]|nr:hypothetical protein [Candidatus Lokiarchaeota archaeon]